MSRALTIVNRLLETDELPLDYSTGPSSQPTPSPAPEADLDDLGVSDEDLMAGTFVRGDPVTSANADSASRFYHRTLNYKRRRKSEGDRPLEVRRNGRTRRWKRNPERFEIPVKYGMYDYFVIDNNNAHDWTTDPSENRLTLTV